MQKRKGKIVYNNTCTICECSFSTTDVTLCYCGACRKLPNKVSLRTKPCINCNNSYKYNKKSSKYCSVKCANLYYVRTKKYVDFRRKSVENTLLSIYWGARNRAKRKSLECTISQEEVLGLLAKQKGLCALTGIKLQPSKQNGSRGKNPWTVSIDRKDSNKGYIKGNVQLVCIMANECKNSYKLREVTKMCKEYIKYNNINV